MRYLFRFTVDGNFFDTYWIHADSLVQAKEFALSRCQSLNSYHGKLFSFTYENVFLL